MNISPAASIDMIAAQDPAAIAAGRTPKELAQNFESLFISLMLKEMRHSLSEGLFPGDKSDTLGGLFDMQMSQQIAQSGGIGIAEAIERYITPMITLSAEG